MKKTITLLLLILFVQLNAQTTYVPDDNFEQALIDLGYDSGALDNYVPTANINTITSLDVHNKNINDLTGIEDFVGLTSLNCQINQLTAINVSNNTALETLLCNNNLLTALDVSNNTALTTLHCNSNQLTTIDVTQNTLLEYFYCDNNAIAGTLNVANNTALKYLYCYTNAITFLDLANNTALQNLYCENNQIGTLDVSNSPSLTKFICYNNQLINVNIKNGNNTALLNVDFDVKTNSNLTCVLVDDVTYSTANWTNIDTQTAFNATQCTTTLTYVPDDNFENYLETHDANGNTVALGNVTSMGNGIANDNFVTTASIETVTNLNIISQNIADLTGIESFAALTHLNCDHNQLASLNITNNTMLDYLRCESNQINTIDVSNNTALTYLSVYHNNLTSIDISNNTLLEHFSCSYNNVENLDASNNPNLTYFKCYNNQLTSLNVKNGNNTAINIYSFKATNNPNLTCILVDDATWSTANWTNIDAQTSFNDVHCSPAGMTYVPDDNFEQALIDLGYDTAPLDDYVPTANINTVTILNVDNKNIADLTGIADFTALEELYLRNDLLTSINLSNNIQLKILNFYNNSITTLDVSANVNLEQIITVQNPLTTLDLSQNPNITKVNCINNNLSYFNIQNGNNANITNLNFSLLGNNNLTCALVDDAAWSTTNWTYVTSNLTFVNSQAECDALYVDDASLEEAISIYPNPAKNSITIANNGNEHIDKITIYNALGAVVFKANSIQNSIDTSNFKTGIYLVQLISDKKSLTKKLIIRK